jgi:DNA repair protein RadC
LQNSARLYYFIETLNMDYLQNPSLGIKYWAEEDRPREKLLLKGRSSLSNAELIAILLGSGTRSQNALDLAKTLLQKSDNNLNELAKFPVSSLTRIKGIGNAKALTIVAAMELYRRRMTDPETKRKKIQSSLDAYDAMKIHLLDIDHEEFWVMILNRANFVLEAQRISSGGLSGTVADPKMIFGIALEKKASSLILVHNHPSGNLKPSSADISLTKKMVEGGKSLDLPIFDHLIFANSGYFSFADEGMI